MTDRELIEKVQKWLDGGRILSEKPDISPADNNKAAAALRMISAYRRYKRSHDSENTTDFECALRNYLLALNTDISINGYTPSEPNRFGLALNHVSGNVYVNYDLPDYVNDSLVQTVYSGISAQESGWSKGEYLVNPYIYRLTKGRFRSFKSVEQQLAVIGALKVPEGYTAMVAMSTGGGKSLITQAVSYQHENSLTLIIVPTISLMLDQHRTATEIISPENSDEICCYYSGCDAQALQKLIEKKRVRMLFISPEAIIKNQNLQKCIFNAGKSGYLQNLVVDEAHIIVEWGSSFRVDFQCLDSFRNRLMKETPGLRTFLLSATYSKKTVDCLEKFFSDSGRWIEIRLDALRKEPRFDIIKCRSYTDKHNKLKELVCKLPHPMIIYVNTPDDAAKIASELAETGFSNTRIFTGRTGSAEREKIINEWVNDRFDLMIATCAFGVGVDKRDVRTVLHSYVPSSPDQYYQECGRGGRDGQPSLSVMLFTDDDISAAKSMTEKVLTVAKLSGRWFSMLSSDKANKNLERVIIDTSVKPDYNENDNFYVEASNADITWNVYVILLLRRAGLINIADVEYSGDRYIFTVTVNDQRILYRNEVSDEIFSNIRDEESDGIKSGIDKLTSKLNKLGRKCWSEMFNDVYMLTDGYCGGCNAHSNVRCGARPEFPLKKQIERPVSEVSGKVKELLSEAGEMLIISDDDPEQAIILLAENGADIVVLPDGYDISEKLLSVQGAPSAQVYMNYEEFFELSKKMCSFYLSGCVVFYVGDDQKLASRLLSLPSSKKYSSVYIADQDIYIQSRGKNISELVNGGCKYGYILEKELK